MSCRKQAHQYVRLCRTHLILQRTFFLSVNMVKTFFVRLSGYVMKGNYLCYFSGSMRGGSDVTEFTRIGITNNVIVPNLRLQNGHAYYVTIRGKRTISRFCLQCQNNFN